MRWMLPNLFAMALACQAAFATPVAAQDFVPEPALSDARKWDAPDPGLLSPRFWSFRLGRPDQVLLDPTAIAAQNDLLLQLDDSLHDLRTLPSTLRRDTVSRWIRSRSRMPVGSLYLANGRAATGSELEALEIGLALDSIPSSQVVQFGLVVERAPLRTFPTMLRVFSRPGDTDIDRFQESALFPGTPVAILHHSRDGQWLFVLSPRYAAWIEKRFVAEGSREQVLGYPDKTPYRLVTGAKPRTSYMPGRPAVSELQLDMGVRLPLATPAPDGTVDGQNPYTSWTVELPVRNDDGSLRFESALLPKTADSADAPLPLTRANIIRQAFKFLGERYGWGHDYNGRDCSGFVSEVYRSMGVLLPRNTGDQAVSAALPHTLFDGADGGDQRAAAVAALQAGDMVYIPGHVMLVIGRIDGVPWVIHDIQNGRILDDDGQLRELHLNAVAVTRLPPLVFDDGRRYIDRITSIVRIGTHEARAAH